VLVDGALAFAIVAIPARLRARMKASSTGRQTEAAEGLPLDVETVRVLEEALSHLYALSELAGEAQQRPRPAPAHTPSSGGQQQGLLNWMPRNPDEEPRVPTLYARHWKGEPDALLALISRVLRLDTDNSSGGEDGVGREQVDLNDLENVRNADQIKVEETPAEAARPTVDPKELERYRHAFKRLFARGLEFVSSTADSTLAGWTFTYLLRLVEDLGMHQVDLHGHKEPLMPREPLRAITLDLLETYLHRGIRDALCLATARVHLAASIRQRNRYAVRDAERLDALCFAWASELIELPAGLPSPVPEALDLDIAGAIAWLEVYADRSNWSAIEKEAAAQLDPGWLERYHWPMIVGSACFPNRLASPAWELLAFAAPAGFASKAPFGVIVNNADDAPVATHAIVCDPRSHLIVEAWERAGDHVWHERRYSSVSRGAVERLRGPFALGDAGAVITHSDLDALNEPLNSLAPLLRDAASAFD
jgi:hypothetical protein